MYKISVRNYSWFDRLIKALFRNNLKTVKSIILKMANSKGDYTMSHQSKDKIRDLKTLKSTISFIIGSLKQCRLKPTLFLA